MPSTPVEAYEYDLPAERIAQRPVEPRDASRLLHLEPGGGLADHAFTDLPELLAPGDLLVVNDTRVRAARLRGTRPGGGAAEILLLRRLDGGPGEATTATYAALVRPARRLPPGTVVEVGEGLVATAGARLAGHPGAREVTLAAAGPVDEAVEHAGTVPLPPYIRERLDDGERYQTVFSGAAPPESAAAPTAGLHFTPRILGRLRERGVETARIRLEVGLGTFTPIRTAAVEDHVMHGERFEVPAETARATAAARARGGRVVAVGTTVVRALESRTAPGGGRDGGEGDDRAVPAAGR
ncbi:MAG TPA: S-adenosylmethionine:tRNA ribosyltransferase-isomerase, partial [Candidatus Dormibacteraeota bacterium]|nr:S-adenosylmethionine:tRNA ribosyltransferase-isomerase [Candidatus Dormibacteraeota bacterium]